MEEREKKERKSKRRGHGEGSVYQRKDGRWVAEIALETGKSKLHYGKTRKEVVDWLNKALYEQKQGILVTNSQQKLKDFLNDWLETVHRPSIKMSSYLKYREYIDHHIIPALGHIKLQKLHQSHIQAFYTKKQDEGLAPRTIHTFHAILHKALDHAVQWDLVAKNVCDSAKPPRIAKFPVRALTREQAHRLLQTVRGHRLEGLLLLALATGMRRGELLALRWSDVDLESGDLHVQKTVDRLKGQGYRETDPKTASSKRHIVLPRMVVDVLKQHRLRQLEERVKAGPAWKEQNLVFTNTVGGFMHPSHLYENFQVILQQAGLPHMRFHDLRHSAATILLTMGIHPKIVQELLGHSNISITLGTYSHVLPSMQKDAMDDMDDFLGEQK